MATLQSDPLLQVLLLIALAVLFLHCVNRAVASAVDADRKSIADRLRGYATASKVERFELLPKHFEEIADDIERGES